MCRFRVTMYEVDFARRGWVTVGSLRYDLIPGYSGTEGQEKFCSLLSSIKNTLRKIEIYYHDFNFLNFCKISRFLC